MYVCKSVSMYAFMCVCIYTCICSPCCIPSLKSVLINFRQSPMYILIVSVAASDGRLDPLGLSVEGGAMMSWRWCGSIAQLSVGPSPVFHAGGA